MNAWLSTNGGSWWSYAFMRHALIAVMLVSPLFALIGGLAINHRMAFYADAIGHAALTGVAIGVLLGLPNPASAILAFSVLLAVLITVFRWKSAAPTDAVIGLTMSIAVAAGLVILSRGGQFGRYMPLLIGDILTLTTVDLVRLAVLGLLTFLTALRFFNAVFLTTLNPSLALSRGIPVRSLELGFAVFVAAVVALCIPWLGLLVVNALLILPAAAARNVARSAGAYFLLSVLFGWAAGLIGLWASFRFDTAAGPTLVLAGGVLYLLTLLIRALRA